MERYGDGIGPKQSAAVTVLGLALGVATFLILFNTLFASSGPTRLDEVLDRYSAIVCLIHSASDRRPLAAG